MVRVGVVHVDSRGQLPIEGSANSSYGTLAESMSLCRCVSSDFGIMRFEFVVKTRVARRFRSISVVGVFMEITGGYLHLKI